MRWLAMIAFLIASPALALELTIPNASVVRDETEPLGRVRLPEAPYSPGAAPTVAEGEVRRQILRVPSGSRTTLQLIEGLRITLQEEGFEEVFACANAACGGFDFRFQLDILGEPDMHVDLGNFVYVLLRTPDSTARPHTVALLASRTQTTGFVHITSVSKPAPVTETDVTPEPVETATPEPQTSPPPVDELIASLTENGHAVLQDLDFGTGAADLDVGSYPSLQTLAAWLALNPSARIVLVGHTDSVGSLEANTALSQRRAASVALHLTAQLGADSRQIQSSGVGYLAPVASNLTAEGRALNRRVEVVLLSAD